MCQCAVQDRDFELESFSGVLVLLPAGIRAELPGAPRRFSPSALVAAGGVEASGTRYGLGLRGPQGLEHLGAVRVQRIALGSLQGGGESVGHWEQPILARGRLVRPSFV